MSVNEGGSILLTDEERSAYYEKARQVAIEDAQASGAWEVLAEGDNAYEREWQINFDWPEHAGIQVGDDYVKDSVTAEVLKATFVVGRQATKNGKRTERVRASSLRRMSFDGNDIRQMREAVGWSRLKEYGGTPDPFAYGSDQAMQGVGGTLGQYLPLWPGPVTRQLYWQDYWMMSAKAFEAYNHDPVSWRCIHMKQEFVLGPGVAFRVTKTRGEAKGQTHARATQAWMEFWQRNKMDQRLDRIMRDYCWSGEQFLRYFKQGPKLTVRSLDPASIYDLITDPEDHETVFAYHQQFQTPYQLYPPNQTTPVTGPPAPTGPSQPGSIVRYIIRQILPQEIDHYRANSSNYERRGRSDLFPALGWIKRLRDYLTSHVIQADMLSRICWDLEVAGNASAIQNLRNQLFPNGRPPQPGTVFGHNSASKLAAIAPASASRASGRGDPILDALVTMVSLSGGIPKDWLGFGLQNTRAGALVATEPASKSLVELAGMAEGMIDDQFNRVMKAAGISDAELETTFPSISAEDRSEKLDDLGTMEANTWISKRTAGSMAAKEIGITNYDFDTEQLLIAAEFPEHEMEDDPDAPPDPLTGKKPKRPKQGDNKIRRSMLIATKRQAPKLDITQSPSPSAEDEPPGLLTPTGNGQLPAPGSTDGTGRTVAGGGNHRSGNGRLGAPTNEDPSSAAGKRDIKKEHTNIRESEPTFELTARELQAVLMRERQHARRRPEDPEYLDATEQYRRDSTENLAELVKSAGGVVHEQPA